MNTRAARAVLVAAAILGGAVACAPGDGGVGTVLVVASVDVTPGISNVILGTTLQLTAAPKTASGIVVSGRNATWSSTDGATASVSSSGLVTGAALGGPVRIRATVDGVNGDALVTVKPVPVDRVTVSPPSAGVLVAGSAQFTASAFDALGAPLLGRSFLWESSEPLIAAVTTTGLVIGLSQGGPVTITATSEGKSGSATASVSTRPATRLAFAQQPGPSTAGAPLNPPIRIALQDNLLETVLGATNSVTIAIAGNPAGGVLGGTTTIDGVNGIATFGNLTLDRVGASYTFQVTSPGLVSATSIPFDVSAGSANRLVITQQPSPNAQSGVVLGVQPVVRLQDGSGNNVTTAGLVVTASIATGGGTLGGTATAITNAQGIASFTNLVISGTVGTFTLSFSVPSVAGATSAPIALAAGPKAVLVITQQPASGAQSGIPLAQQPVLQLRDAAGNNVAEAGVPVLVGLASGTGSVGGSTTALTNGAGAATFSISINGPSGVYTLGFSSTGLTPITSGPITLGAGAPTQLAITTQPSPAASSGAVLVQQPVIQLRDASNNPVLLAGVGITATVSAGATLIGVTAVNSNAAGVATFTGVGITGPVGTYTITFAAPGISSAVSGNIILSAGAPALLTITTQPSATPQSGVLFPQQPVVQVRDGANNAVSQAGLVITAVIASGPVGSTLSGLVTATTNGSGVATFATLAINGTIGVYTLRFTSGGLTPIVSGNLTLGPGVATKLSITTQPSAAAQSGVALVQQPAIQLRDAADNAVPQAGVVITAAIATGGGTLGGTLTAVTNASGVATFADLAISGTIGVRTLTFTSGVLTAIASGNVTLSAGPASKLSITTQPANLAQSGVAFTAQPAIQLRDASDNAVSSAGVDVSAAVASGGGTLGGTVTITTNASGVASFTNLMITGTSGDRTLSFSATSLTSVTSGTITISAGAPSLLSVSTQPSAAALNAVALVTQPVIQLRDGANNPVSLAGVVVTAAIASGGGVLGGTLTATTGPSGVATFSDLRITGTIGSRTLIFSAPTYTSVISSAITVTAGAATALALTTQPTPAPQSGVAFPAQPAVQLWDVSGNNVSTAGIVVTAAITVGGTGTLGGTPTATTNASGLATFATLAISGVAGAPSRTLTFTAPTLTSVVSGAITLSAGPASKLTITTQPSAAAQSGVAFAVQPVLQLRDAADNAVSQAGVVVTAAIASGGGSLTGTITATSSAAGVATFTNLVISGTPGARTLTFTSGVLTATTSGTITLSPGPASQLTITTTPSTTAQSGVAFPQQPVLQLRDAAGNAVSQLGVNVTAAIASGGGTIGGTSVIATNASGVAAFPNLMITGTAGDRTLTFSAAGVTSATSGVITVTAGAASNLSMTTQPSASAASGVALAVQPAIQLRDASNNPVSLAGVVVAAGISSGGGTLGGALTATTNANGLAAFIDLAITGVIGNRTLIFTAVGYTSVTSASITITPGAATQLSVSTQPSLAPQSGVVFGTQPAIQLRDASGNAVSQAGVVVTTALSAGSTGTLGGTLTATTSAGGLATFTNLSISGLVGSNRTLDFTSPGLTTVVSSTIVLVAGPQSQISITTIPSAAAQSGVAFTGQPVLQLRDAAGNAVAVSGVPILASVATGPGGTLGGSTIVTTDGGGTAAFTNLSLSGATGAYTISFSSAGLTSPTPAGVTLSAGPGSILGLVTAPSASVQNVILFPAQPVLQLRDGANNPVATAGVSVSVLIQSGGGTLNGTTTVLTDVNGTATFTNLSITGTIGARTLLFSAAGFTSPPVSNVTVTAGTATKLFISTAPSTPTANATPFATQPIIQLRDVSDNNVSQALVNVTAAFNSGTATTLGGTLIVATNGSGQAVYTDLSMTGLVAGTRTLRFTATGLTQTVTGSLALTAGAATQLTITTQPSITAASGVAFIQQPAIQLRDVSGNAVSSSGVVVTAAVATGTGTIGGTPTAGTNGSGLATFTNLAINGTAGPFTIGFSAPALTGVTSGTVTLSAGAATKLGITTQPSASAASGAAFAQQPALQLLDASNNPISSAGVVVSAAITPPGTGTLGTTLTAATNTSGVATFLDLKITGLVGSRTIDFTALSLTGVTSSAVTITAGAASQLTMTTQPSAAAQSGVAFPTQPAVQLRDAAGNAVSQSGIQVTAAIASGDAAIGGTVLINTDASGVATFTNLSIAGIVGNRTLSFSTGVLTPAISSTVVVGAGPTATYSFIAQPSATATNGTPFATQPSLQLRDVSGNATSTAGISITANIASGAGAALGGNVARSSNGSGVVNYNNLQLTGTVGNFTLGFAGTGISGPASTSISLGAGAATTLAANSAISQSATVGTAVSAPPSAKATDASGNAVSGIAVAFAVGIGGGSVLPAISVNTDAFGIATATSWTLGTTAGTNNNTATATAAGLAGSPVSFTASATAGAATQLTVTTQPSASAANAVAFAAQPAIQLRDASDNPVATAGVVITAALASGGVTLGGTLTAITDVGGLATFSNLSITGLVGSRTLTFTSGSLTAATSTAINITTGARSKLTITTQPSASATSDVAFATQPVVRIEDSGGNPVSENLTAVTASLASGAITLGGTLLASTNASGVASFTDLKITGATGARTLLFAATGLTSATSTPVTLGAGSATKLFIATQPSASAANAVAFAAQPAIQLRDASDNPVATAGVVITAAIASGGGTPGGTLTASTDVGGLATFTNLSITGLVGSRTLTFTSGSLTAATSTAINITTGAPFKLTVTTAPSSTAANDIVFPSQPIVRIEDSGGNPVSQGGTAVTASITSGGGTLGGTLAPTTAGTGVATFNDLKITGTTGARTLQFAATGLTSTTAGVTLGAGTATQLFLATPPSATAQSGTPFGTQPAVQLRDVSGNNVPQSGIVITAAIASGGVALGGTLTATTDGAGLATFTSLSITGTIGIRTLSFTSGSLTAVNSGNIDITAGAATQLAITTQPVGGQTGAALATQPVVDVRDAEGNVVTTDNTTQVTVTILSGAGGTLGGTLTVTVVNGVATFTNVTLTGTPVTENYVLQFTSSPVLTPATSINVTVTP